jgi:predicted regulator of Ras-like GTPase activity (Roadblock/LC7/MglB family)
MDLAQILANMVADEGLTVALIVGDDGILVEGQCREGIDLPSVAAQASKSLNDLHHLARTLDAGAARRMRVRFDHYELLIEALTDTDILVAGVSSVNAGEQLLEAAARYRFDLRKLLGDL